ncbi:group II intron reverse transcriptase/maturase [bacterium]|nr:group II intron reverse transcriptase/maturase [bacterium]
MQNFITSDADEAWLKRVQTMLAKRSVEGGSFNRVFNLLRTKRLARTAITHVLKNKGARTPGVDGKSKEDYATLTSRYALTNEIISELKAKRYQPSPVRRVYIPKANGKMRPLGIPTIKDRVVQEMLRLILEPIYEGKFYKHSYGFRPYRSTHHAAQRLKSLHGRFRYEWAVEGDIKACFDEIEHGTLIRILQKTIKDGRVIYVIRKTLSAGIVEEGSTNIVRPKKGTPQGGIISPLLANVFLNELDRYVEGMYEAQSQYRRNRLSGRFIVRYADDFVIVCKTEEDAKLVKELVKDFLAELGLELSNEKTHIIHINDGYDFLGFNIRRFRDGKTLIQPSKAALKKFRRAFKERLEIALHKYDFSTRMIRYLDSLVKGWGNYYKWVSSKKAFKKLDHYIWWSCYRRSRRHMGTKVTKQGIYLNRFLPMPFSRRPKDRRYNRRQFGVWVEEGKTAELLTWLPSIPIKYASFHPQLNPYLPGNRELLEQKKTLSYESDSPRQLAPVITGGYGPGWQATRRAVLRRDKYRCTRCGVTDVSLEIHHVDKPKGTPGAENLDNLTTLCRQCHIEKHRKPIDPDVVVSEPSH